MTQSTKIAEANAWIVFFDQRKLRTVNLADDGAEYQSLHGSLIARVAESSQIYKAWEEKKDRGTQRRRQNYEQSFFA